MKIFFTCSYSGKEKYQKYFDKVLESIKANNVEVISPEDKSYLEVLNEKRKNKLKNLKEIHYESIKRSVFESDAVIIDTSFSSFRLGYEAALAVQNKKPTLILSINEDYSKYIQDNYFYASKYTIYNVKEIVREFIENASRKLLNNRFNMFLSDEQVEFIEKQANLKNISKSEVIRELIEKDRE